MEFSRKIAPENIMIDDVPDDSIEYQSVISCSALRYSISVDLCDSGIDIVVEVPEQTLQVDVAVEYTDGRHIFVTRLLQLNPASVEIDIPEFDVGHIRKGVASIGIIPTSILYNDNCSAITFSIS